MTSNLAAVLLGAVLALSVVPAIAQDQPAAAPGQAVKREVKGDVVRIGSRWIASTFLNNEGGKLQNTTIKLAWVSSMWTIEPVEGSGSVLIHSVWQQDQYLNVDGGKLGLGAVPAGATTAQWTVEPVGRGFYQRFRSVSNPELYLNVAKGELQASPIEADSLSADWWLLK
jgi:hypothetical protein